MNRYVDDRGFTLIEVIISIAILGILITPIFTLININLKLNRESKEQLMATNLAESEIEKLKFSDFVKLGNMTTDKDGFTIDSLIESISGVSKDEDKKEIIDSKRLYRITVEVKKDEKTIEKLLTYKSSLEGSDSN